MKVFDVHVHSGMPDQLGTFDAQDLISKLGKAGIYGSCVFSERPAQFYKNMGYSGHTGTTRLDDVLKGCEGYRDRLLPILWLHPDEEGVLDLIQEAAEKGIMGFKVICNNFYVYEDKSMRMLEAVAKTGKPVLFHSGILWDDSESSKYNRPLHWEALCKMPGLRFSLAHCSWPWYDETIALYGKFLTNHLKHPDENSEMFFDTTPGTPVPYRKDLYTKLLGCGYDVEHNIIWGTDCRAENYNYEWANKWLKIDNAIMDELGTPEEIRDLIFNKNMQRFFGLTDEAYSHEIMNPDGTTTRM